MIFSAVVENGKPVLSTPEKFKKFLSGFRNGQRIQLSVEEHKTTRSISQNAYYWAYLGIISNETGNESVVLHEYFKRIFLKPKRTVVLGKEILLPSDTKSLSKYEFGEYLDRICALVNIPLPDPSALGYIPSNISYLGNYDKKAKST